MSGHHPNNKRAVDTYSIPSVNDWTEPKNKQKAAPTFSQQWYDAKKQMIAERERENNREPSIIGWLIMKIRRK